MLNRKLFKKENKIKQYFLKLLKFFRKLKKIYRKERH